MARKFSLLGPKKAMASSPSRERLIRVEDKISFLTFANVTPITLISDFGPDSLYAGMLKAASFAECRMRGWWI